MKQLCRLNLRFLCLLVLLMLYLVFGSSANAHIPAYPHNNLDRSILKFQEEAYSHSRYVCVRGTGEQKRWHCAASIWLEREIHEMRAKLAPSLAWRQTITAWLPTYYCERDPAQGWASNTGNGFYGGLQFNHQTWVRYGGLKYGWNAHLATPQEQVLVAAKLTYDGWPNCPNP